MTRAETSDTLTVLVYTGSTGAEHQKALSKFYSALHVEKPQSFMEIAVDRSDVVYDLDLPPALKVFLTSGDADRGGQLTPQKTLEVIEKNIQVFYNLIDRIREQAMKVGAKEVRAVFVHTLVGGTGFTVAVWFALMLKDELSMPVSITFVPTTPPLAMFQRPTGIQDIIKVANTIVALREMVVMSRSGRPKIDLAFLRFPHGMNAGEQRFGYFLRATGLLPVEDRPQKDSFQQEQMMAISSEKGYPLALTGTVLIRFPKSQLKQREALVEGFAKLKEASSSLGEKKNSIASKLRGFDEMVSSSSDLPPRLSKLQGRLIELQGVRSKRWRRTIEETQAKVNSAKLDLENVTGLNKTTGAKVEDSEKQLEDAESLASVLGSLCAELDEVLATGHYKNGSYVLRVSREDREKLGLFSTFQHQPLTTIMTKLGREKEFHDLLQEQLERTGTQLLQQLIGSRFPENPHVLDEVKIVSSAGINLSGLVIPAQGVQKVEDPVLDDEVVVACICMVELEPEDPPRGAGSVGGNGHGTFSWIKRAGEVINQVPGYKRISIPVSDDKEKAPEEYLKGVKLRGADRYTPFESLFRDDEHWPVV
jgi:hypothetical protein